MHLITPMILYFLAQDLIPGHWPVSLAPVHTRSDRRVVHTALAQARAVQLGQPGERAGRRPARRSQAESVVQGERGHRARAQPDEAGEEEAGDGHAPEAAQPAGHARQREGPADRHRSAHGAQHDRRGRGGEGPRVLHLPRGLQVSSAKGARHLHVQQEGRARAAVRGQVAQERRPLHRHSLQPRAHRLPHERHPFVAHVPRRVGERHAAERQHHTPSSTAYCPSGDRT